MFHTKLIQHQHLFTSIPVAPTHDATPATAKCAEVDPTVRVNELGGVLLKLGPGVPTRGRRRLDDVRGQPADVMQTPTIPNLVLEVAL